MDPRIMMRVFHQTIDPRRRKEQMDFNVVQEDHTKVANLSEHGYQVQSRSSQLKCGLDHDSEVGLLWKIK